MIGDIVLMINKDDSLLPNAIRYFTGKIAQKKGVKTFTHSCFSVGNVLKEESVLSAELSMTVMPLSSFRTEQFYFEVYKIKDKFIANNGMQELLNLISQHYKKSAGKPYGFFQNVWFMYRFLMENLGFNMIGSKNWFPNNENCSESTANYLLDRFRKMTILSNNVGAFFYLNQFNTNTIHPVDLAIMVKENSHLFELVETYGTV